MFSQLVGLAIKATILFVVAWLAALALRRSSAAARHLVWTAAAAAVLALPFLSIGLPALNIPVKLPSSITFSTTAIAAQVSVPPAYGAQAAHAGPQTLVSARL